MSRQVRGDVDEERDAGRCLLGYVGEGYRWVRQMVKWVNDSTGGRACYMDDGRYLGEICWG